MQLATKQSDTHDETAARNCISGFLRDGNGVYTRTDAVEKFHYTDGRDGERYVLNTLRSVRDLSTSSEELKSKIIDWISEYHFSRERHNLLRHLRIDAQFNILELGCGCGAITRQLGESGARVTAIEGSYDRALSAAARCRDLSNVKVYCSKFQDVAFSDTYDIVTLIGVLEYSPLFFNSADPIADCLRVAKHALKPDGVVVIAIENQLGLKYFCGYREDHVDLPFYGIEDRYNPKTAITFGRKELMRKVQGAGLNSVEFQYPFPDYKIPRTVFTQRAFANERFHPEEILRQLSYRDYCGKVSPLFEQELTIPVICRNGIMEELSNSFLVLASRNKQSIENLGEPNLLAAFYATDRAKAFNIRTSFIETQKDILVRKDHIFPEAWPSRKFGVLVQDMQESVYIDGKNLEAEFRRCVKLKDFAQLSRLLKLQVDFLKRYAIKKIHPGNPALSEIHPEFVDCVPSNLVLHNGALHYFDREWKLDRRVSFGALLMRTIDALHELDKKQPELRRENLIQVMRSAGIAINAGVVAEYNQLVNEIVSQIYQSDSPAGGKIQARNDWAQSFFEYVKDNLAIKNAKHPDFKPLWDRLTRHIDMMLEVYRGKQPGTYLDEVRASGPVHKNEATICAILLKEISGHDAWRHVAEFAEKLIETLQCESPREGVAKPASGTHNPLERYKRFEYGDAFRNFICPNPFIYMEFLRHGEISCCCYLAFTMGSILKKPIHEIWNSEIAQELRRSILRGEYCYCDKSKCAAMQAAVLPEKKNGFNYQVPYQLIEKSRVQDSILKACIAAGEQHWIASPRIISFEDDPSCNLSCPSCRKTVYALEPEESANALTAQVKLLDSVGADIEELWFCGAGEVLAAASYRKLIRQLDITKFAKTRIRLDTNAVLFKPQAWETRLKNIQPNIQLIAVSLDAATEATYRNIRRGGNFKSVLENLEFIAGLARRRKGLHFIIRMIVQQKNFREMKAFVELGRSLGADGVVFSAIQNWGTFSKEEYRVQAVHLADHPEHGDLCTILKDDIFRHGSVDLGNLAQLHFEVNHRHVFPALSVNVSTAAAVSRLPSAAPRARVIAFYLPQYHPIPENDQWWGKGFTEWTNVRKAKPLYKGHYQPHRPADLGYYDLRSAEARNAQAELAKRYGIEAFCYWHYWFAGHRLLERPYNEVVLTGKPDFPFCLGWANQTWSGIWHGAPDKILIEQTYPGKQDYRAHFYALLPGFRDPRYLRINDKLVFLIYSPGQLPDARYFTDYWQELAIREGLPGFHFIAHMSRVSDSMGCQSCVDNAPFYDMQAPAMHVEPFGHATIPKIFAYHDLVKYLNRYQLAENEHPIVFPNWDNTPRSGANGVVLHGSTPDLFAVMMEDAVRKACLNPDAQKRIVFIKAWNEWAEGNHLEPDEVYGHGYLEVVRRSIYPVQLPSEGPCEKAWPSAATG